MSLSTRLITLFFIYANVLCIVFWVGSLENRIEALEKKAKLEKP